jgi:pyrroline-5-carboxylate reductase
MAKPEFVTAGLLSDWAAPILMVGCGNMAGAILARWLDCGLSPALVRVADPSGRPVAPGVAVDTGLPEHVAPGTVVLLGIKPQNLGDVAPALDARLGSGCAVISMLAGLPLSLLSARLPSAGTIVRIMPNLPVRTGEGTVLTHAAAGGSPDTLAAVDRLLAPLGLVERLADEGDFDLATALSGCGPAYVYRFVDALAGAAVRLGMDQAQAMRLALQTVAGAGATALHAAQSPGELADAVASPGGMTRLGLDVLDADERLLALLTDTLRAARDRGAELAAVAANA